MLLRCCPWAALLDYSKVQITIGGVRMFGKRTNWTKATTDLYEAMVGVFAAQRAGHNAWLEHQKNGEQEFPVKIKNPILDDPFNWTMLYGVPLSGEIDDVDREFFNETEEDLFRNWIACFGEPKAIEHYWKTGKVIEGLIRSAGTCFPLRRKDHPRPEASKHWVYMWKPKNDVPYWVVDPDVEYVFQVVYDGDYPPNQRTLVNRLVVFLDELDIDTNPLRG
jgi:hypothetical protein